MFYFVLLIISAKFSAMLPKSIPKTKYQLQFTEGTNGKKLDWINVKFTLHDVICFVSCAILGSFYLYSKVCVLFIFFGFGYTSTGCNFYLIDSTFNFGYEF